VLSLRNLPIVPVYRIDYIYQLAQS
jgi:hypothetical protein